MPVAVVALLWNLVGCAAYLGDVLTTPDAVAAMSAEQRALYESRPAWAVSATAIAVWAGAAGCVGLILRRRWAIPLLLSSLAGLVVQNVWLFALSGAAAQAGAGVVVLQGIVLLIALALVVLSLSSARKGWLA
jgi:hypothetical protein